MVVKFFKQCPPLEFLFWSRWLRMLYSNDVYYFNFTNPDRGKVFNELVSILGDVSVREFRVIKHRYNSDTIFPYKAFEYSDGSIITTINMKKLFRNRDKVLLIVTLGSNEIYYFKFTVDLLTVMTELLYKYDNHIKDVKIYKNTVKIKSDRVIEVNMLHLLLLACKKGYANYYTEYYTHTGYSGFDYIYCSYIPKSCKGTLLYYIHRFIEVFKKYCKI